MGAAGAGPAPAPAALGPLAGAAGCFASAAGTLAAGGWLNAAVALAPACGPLFTAIPAAERLAAGNIIVLPASSGAGGAAGPDGTAFAGCGSGFAGAEAFATGGAAKIAVAFMFGALGVATGPGAGGEICAPGAPGRVTLNVFWHFPHRMVSP